MVPSFLSRKKLAVLLASLGYVALSCTPAFTQIVSLADGPVNVRIKFDLPIRPAQTPETSASTTSGISSVGALDTPALTSGLQFYTTNYTSLAGKQLPFNIVGTDPSLGANTTIVPTVLVPLQFIFRNPGNPTLDGTNVKSAVQNSPIFQNADYTAGSVE